jgi:hypothetical protein
VHQRGPVRIWTTAMPFRATSMSRRLRLPSYSKQHDRGIKIERDLLLQCQIVMADSWGWSTRGEVRQQQPVTSSRGDEQYRRGIIVAIEGSNFQLHRYMNRIIVSKDRATAITASSSSSSPFSSSSPYSLCSSRRTSASGMRVPSSFVRVSWSKCAVEQHHRSHQDRSSAITDALDGREQTSRISL